MSERLWNGHWSTWRMTVRKPGRPRCECGRRLACAAHSRRARPGYIRRPKHDLCHRCYRTALDRLAAVRLAIRRTHARVQAAKP